jgi:hypothetical protein
MTVLDRNGERITLRSIGHDHFKHR